MALKLSATQMAKLRGAIDRGLARASGGLSEMVQRTVGIESPLVDLLRIEEVPTRVGGEGEAVAAIYLAVEGDVRGHIIIFFSIPSAKRLAGLLLETESEPEAELGEMELSALSEVGNLTGSFVLNSLADDSGLRILPSSPSLVCDMAGAVLNTVLAELSLAGEQALVVETTFRGADDEIQGLFFLLPELHSLQVLVEALGRRL